MIPAGSGAVFAVDLTSIPPRHAPLRLGARSMEGVGSAFEEVVTLRQAKQLIQCMAHEQSFLLLSPPGPVSYTHLDVYKRQL